MPKRQITYYVPLKTVSRCHISVKITFRRLKTNKGSSNDFQLLYCNVVVSKDYGNELLSIILMEHT